jgi:hypothetical protein
MQQQSNDVATTGRERVYEKSHRARETSLDARQTSDFPEKATTLKIMQTMPNKLGE